MKNYLSELRKMENLTQEQLAEKLNLSLATIKKYESERQIPIDQALIISEMFDVSLDWLYCKNDIINERDTMVEVLQSLNKVFKIPNRKNHNGDDVVLLINSKFRDFLRDINELYIDRQYSFNIDKGKKEKAYNELREGVFEKHKPIIKSIFDELYFNEKDSQEIHDIEDFTDSNVLDVLG
ncbi:helix-turn-helix transcriptional regulator [Staphylococcus gallinarum]|uniref:helix-turn-helix transcriptional regulator n=1 Tax=Staphylococcus gallinarum TaxID=1293 RepID=UPI00211BE21C|nr:helix-turn-helix transcriptional regulator [Staphylococcus gallinarum]MCQ9289446.1 helix-turn-helix transcriptional regulator [Staphylococcus gallinarum]